MVVFTTSRPVSGAKVISRSCGYCESHSIEAPRSIIPICTSKSTPAFDPFAPPAA